MRAEQTTRNPIPPRGGRPAAPERPQDLGWRLPSGEDLISFALATGCAADLLRRTEAAPPAALTGEEGGRR